MSVLFEYDLNRLSHDMAHFTFTLNHELKSDGMPIVDLLCMCAIV